MANTIRIIVITGATRGCGRAMVERFIETGHTVVGCGRTESHVAAPNRMLPS